MFMHPKYTAIMFLVAGASVLNLEASKPAFAAGVDWRNAPYPYSIINQDVGNAVKNFGYNTGLKVSVAQDVKGTVRGHQHAGTAREFLDEITKSNDLDWYSDGTVIYVSPTADEETALVPLNEFSFSNLKRHLAEFGLIDKRFRLAKRKAGDVAVVSGPPSYVAVIKQAIQVETGGKDQPDSGASGTLVVFRGNASSSIKLP